MNRQTDRQLPDGGHGKLRQGCLCRPVHDHRTIHGVSLEQCNECLKMEAVNNTIASWEKSRRIGIMQYVR